MMWSEPERLLHSILGRMKEPSWDFISEAWDSLEDIRNMGEPVSLKEGKLTIKVKNSAYMQILSMKKSEIKRKINRKYKPGEIKEIKFIIS
ncbi:MAG: DUF721 domain-containing protein [Elusimicrobiota bacterium]